MADWISASKDYVTPERVSRDPWAAEAAAHGRTGRHRLVDAGHRTPPPHVSRLLGIGEGQGAILRRRHVYLDDQVVEVSDSWYAQSLAGDTALARNAPIKGGAAKLLAELGHAPVRHVEEVCVVPAPEEVIDLLGSGLLIELTRASYAADGTVVEVAHMLMSVEMAPGAPRRLRYELPEV